MKLMFEIEEAMLEADALRSMLLAVTDSACNSGYTFDAYEAAFNYVCTLAYQHFKRLKELTDKAFALSDEKKQKKAQVLHMQAERKEING